MRLHEWLMLLFEEDTVGSLMIVLLDCSAAVKRLREELSFPVVRLPER